MSAISASARSIFDPPVLTLSPWRLLHVALLEHRRHRLDGPRARRRAARAGACRARRPGTRRRRRRRGRRPSRRTRGRRGRRAARSRGSAGCGRSVRLPRRIVPIWVSEPIGVASPLRMASTPAMKVVPTAPMPGSRTPSLPVAGAIGGFESSGTPATLPDGGGAAQAAPGVRDPRRAAPLPFERWPEGTASCRDRSTWTARDGRRPSTRRWKPCRGSWSPSGARPSRAG